MDAQSKLYPQRHICAIAHVLKHFRREKFAEFVPEVFSLESGEYLNESLIVDTVRNGSIFSALFAILLAKIAKTINYIPICTLLGTSR